MCIEINKICKIDNKNNPDKTWKIPPPICLMQVAENYKWHLIQIKRPL